MEITARTTRQIILFSMLLVVVPMVVFPERFGLSLARTSLINILYEAVFYGVVCYLFSRTATLLQLVQVTGLCLIYRMAAGALFGFTISAMYSMDLGVSLSLGMSGYLPTVLLQIVATPFVLRPVAIQLVSTPLVRRAAPPPTEIAESGHTGGTTIAVSTKRGVSRTDSQASLEMTAADTELQVETLSETTVTGGNGFERATRYIGEDTSVHLAAVVDFEGLLLGHFQRGDAVAEDWAPYALLVREANRGVLHRAGWGEPESVTLALTDRRVVVTYDKTFCLLVVADPQMDDFVKIRIRQGLEIVRKYIAERYGDSLVGKAEKTYV
ncbi:MAG: hypothetical protein KAU35_01340 [candidate division Zixibacteria bacterium]|nr:hypothetical protein [candidate division Zixibacteria bacterium]